MRSTDPLVLRFEDITGDMLGLVGGKAANLGVMTRAGLPVPPGFCVTTEAYRRVAEPAGLGDILRLLAGTAPGDIAALAGLAGKARELIVSAPVPADIAAAVRRLADGPVAVRSSATAEDLPHASFAGQQDTYLNVVGPDAVLDAVRRCWASLWTDRAVAYRAANGIDHRAVRLAVVIQRMVDAEVAGVMFTANPVTGRRRQAVIDAAPGLGEAVVSGAVNPDHFVVNPGGEVVERRPGDKLLAIRSLPGGGTERVERAGDGAACLTDEQVGRLAALGERVEEHYGAPQDTEWALDADGRFWLTQARPITTLFPVPESDLARGHPGELRVYFCFSLAQGLHRPITPMGRSAIRVIGASAAALFGLPLADPYAGPPVLAMAGERVFLDLTPALRSRVGREFVPRVLSVMEARSGVVLSGLFDDPRLSVTHRSRRPVMRLVLRVAWRYGLPGQILRAIANPDSAQRRAERVEAELRRRLPLPGNPSPAERLDHVRHLLTTSTVRLFPQVVPGAGAGFLGLGLAARLLDDRAAPGTLTTVLRGLPGNVTTEMDLALWDLAARLRADEPSARLLAETPAAEIAARRGSLPPALEEGLAEFLAAYGHRAVAEIDVGVPRWSDDPSHVIGVLANYLRLDDPALAPDALFTRGAAEAEAMVRDLAGRVGRLRGRVVRFALGRARRLAGLREMPKFLLILTLQEVHRQLSAVGAELAARGRVDDADDVFFLTLPEARAALDGKGMRERVTERRAAYERETRRRRIPCVLLSDGTEPEAVSTTTAADGALTGSAASAGSVTGTARVVLEPVGAHLEPGEILVAPSTDPGWTPLFLTAGGLVMEMGGANSHGAVVAREYGIPAVVGVHSATERIASGRRITVNGTNGTVTLD